MSLVSSHALCHTFSLLYVTSQTSCYFTCILPLHMFHATSHASHLFSCFVPLEFLTFHFTSHAFCHFSMLHVTSHALHDCMLLILYFWCFMASLMLHGTSYASNHLCFTPLVLHATSHTSYHFTCFLPLCLWAAIFLFFFKFFLLSFISWVFKRTPS